MCFKRHPDGRWGLEPQRWPDGHTDYWRPLNEQDKPWLLRGQDHGTQVVLLVQHERHDTTQAPASVTDARRHWISRYLNARFLRLPVPVEVLVREQHGREPGQLQRIHGEQQHLERRAVAAGTVELGDATANWWVLDDDHRARRHEAALWASSGHAAAVYGDELYDILPQTRGGYDACRTSASASATNASCSTCTRHGHAGRLQCNTARTLLLLDHEPLPWARWGEEFTAVMPAEILQLQEHAASTDMVPRREAIRNRVNAILPLYQLSSYRPTPPPRRPATRSAKTAGAQAADTPAQSLPPNGKPAASAAGPPPDGQRPDNERDNDERPIDAAHDSEHPHPTASLPDVAWISGRDGSCAAGDLEDQAARYHPGRHELTINADFRAIGDLMTHWQDRYRGVAGAQAVIDAHVREWCAQILVGVVLAARNTTSRAEQLGALLSPTSSPPPYCPGTSCTQRSRSDSGRSSGHHAPTRTDVWRRDLERAGYCAAR